MVIIDTGILIQVIKDDSLIRKEVTALLEQRSAVITPIQLAEIYGQAILDEIPLISAFLAVFKLQNFTRKNAELAGRYMQQYSKFYPELTLDNCLVGAVAAANDYEIYTDNPKRYPMTEVSLYHKTVEKITAKSKPRLDDQLN